MGSTCLAKQGGGHNIYKYRLPLGSMTPYTPLNITNIYNIDLIHAIPPQYLLTPVNIYEFLLPRLYLPTPTTLSSFILPPLISNNSNNPTQYPISNKPYSPRLIPASHHYTH